jgi:hypothetical protein
MTRFPTLALFAGLLLGCASSTDFQAPPPDRLPISWAIRGLPRLSLGAPVPQSGAVLVPDSVYLFHRLVPIDRWYRFAPAPGSGFTEVYVWLRRQGGVGCIIAHVPPSRTYAEVVADYEARFGPSLREDSTSNPVARWRVWADRKAIWGVVGPKQGYPSLLAVMLAFAIRLWTPVTLATSSLAATRAGRGGRALANRRLELPKRGPSGSLRPASRAALCSSNAGR